ncbi:MAG: flagellar basal body protein [Pirellulaceae bacterium]
MFNFSIAQSSLASNQFAIDAISNNIANANSPGFHRREVTFAANKEYYQRGQLVGAGVDVSRIRSIRSLVIESSLSSAIGDTQAMQQQLAIESQIESLFTFGAGSLYDQHANFFNELARLSSDPSQASQRNVVLEQGKQLASQFRFIGNRLNDIKSSTRQQLESEVTELNRKIEELADVQKRINVASARSTPNQLMDERDMIINEIAELIDVDRNELTQEGFGVTIAGSSMTLGAIPMHISVVDKPDGTVSLQINELGRTITPPRRAACFPRLHAQRSNRRLSHSTGHTRGRPGA